MKESIGIKHITYSAVCPECQERTYSNIHRSAWSKLEYSDGTPYGILKCPECKKDFELSIGDEIL